MRAPRIPATSVIRSGRGVGEKVSSAALACFAGAFVCSEYTKLMDRSVGLERTHDVGFVRQTTVLIDAEASKPAPGHKDRSAAMSTQAPGVRA